MINWMSNLIVATIFFALISFWFAHFLPKNKIAINIFALLTAITYFIATSLAEREISPILFWGMEIFCASGFIFYSYRLIIKIRDLHLSSG